MKILGNISVSDGAPGADGVDGVDGVDGAAGVAGADGSGYVEKFIQMSCTDTTTNINIDTVSPASINFSVVDAVSDASDFSNSSGVVTINTAGVYEVYFTIIIYSLAARANPYIRVSMNGTMTDITGGTYIRNASNHKRSNSQATGLLTFSAGDTMSVKSKYSNLWGTTGTVTMLDGTKLIIKKIG